MDVAEGEAGLVFVRVWYDKSRFYGNDKLAKFANDDKISPVSGGLIIGSPAAWFFVNHLDIQDFTVDNPEIEVMEMSYTAGCLNKADELRKKGYELLRSIEGPNIGLYGMDKDGKVHLIQHLEGDYSVLKKPDAAEDEPKVVFIRDLSRKKYVQYTGGAGLTENLSAAGYALSLD